MGLPARATLTGALAGVVGTAVMDMSHFVPYKRGGGEQHLLAWEFSEGMTWQTAQAPALVGKKVAETVLRRDLPDTAAPLVNNVMHWAYGISWGAVYGIATTLSPFRQGVARAALQVAFAPSVWLSGYVLLPPLKLYKPIWQYSVGVLAKDLASHLFFGAGTIIAFRLLRGLDR